MSTERKPTVALLPWGDVIEDWLAPLGVSLDAFRNEMSNSSWIFGYSQALRLAGVRPVLFCVSKQVASPTRFPQGFAGSPMWVLPASRGFRIARAGMIEEAVRSQRNPWLVGRAALRHLAPYLATPLRLLSQALRREGCDALLCQEYEYPRFDACVLLGRLIRMPVFATFQGQPGPMSRLERPVRQRTLRACQGLIIGATAEAERIAAAYGIPLSKVARIFNPIDVHAWTAYDRLEARARLNLAADAKVVVWHGRVYVHVKGLDVLLDAWDRLCRKLGEEKLQLLLVGTGPERDQLRRLMLERPLRNVRWLDEFVLDRAEIRRYLSSADLYALPSRREGFPVAPLEAMACGLPVVAADAPGVRDIFERGERSGGLVVPRGDPQALAEAMARVLDHDSWARELGQRARRRIEDAFALERVGQQLRDFLTDPKPASAATTASQP